MLLNNLLSTIKLVFNPSKFFEALPYMGLGMLGIFIVMGVIILIMTAMGKIEQNIEKKKLDKQNKDTEN